MSRLRTLSTAALTGTAFVTGRRSKRCPSGPKLSIAEIAQLREQARRRSPDGRVGGAPALRPGQDASSPLEIPAAGWKQVVKRAWQEQKDDNVGLLAAGVTYYAFLAIFPALIAAVTLYGLVADPDQVAAQVQSLADTLPPEAATLLQDQLTSITSTSSGALGVGLAVSVLGALFSASGGVGNLVKTINLAYDEEETRGAVRLRLLALALTLGAVVFVLVAIGLIAVLPVVLDAVGLGGLGGVVAFVLRWAGLVAFMVLGLGVLYRYAPDRDAPQFRWAGLGSVVATVLWIVASAALSVYVSNFGSYGKTYGALAGVVVLLLWLYVTSFIVLLGAEVNAEAERQTARDTTQGPAQPMGEREAVAADTLG